MIQYSGQVPWRRVRRVVQGAVPTAGASPFIDVPAGTIWVPAIVTAVLVTGAVVATRVPHMILSVDGATLSDIGVTSSQAASLTRRYSWVPRSTPASAPNSSNQSMGLYTLPAGARLAITTDLIDAADQWSALSIYVDETLYREGDIALIGGGGGEAADTDDSGQ